MKLTENDIRRIISEKENDRCEFKRAKSALPETLWETYSAFCNSDGGIILLGVREEEGHRAEIEGVEDPHKLIEDFWNVANNGNKVSHSVGFAHYVYAVGCENGKTIIVIEVPRAPREVRPVYVGTDVFAGTYRRNGEGDYHCSRESVRAMLRDQCPETADLCVIEKMTITDLNADTIRRYRKRFQRIWEDHVWNDLPDDEFLTKIGAATLTAGGIVRPTLAGLVCFGTFNAITNELPNYFLDFRERGSGETRWTDRVCAHDANWSGNIYDFFFLIRDRLLADIRRPFALEDDGTTAQEESDIHKAVRELLANALIHADYRGRQGIVIEKRFRQLSFSNPGTFRISTSVAIAGGTSDARNSKIFNILALVKIGERSGMGLSDVFGRFEREGLPRPVVSESYEPDRTVVTACLETAQKSLAADKYGTKNRQERRQKVDKKKTISRQENLSDLSCSARRVFAELVKNPYFTQAGLVSRLDLSRAAITVAIATLIKRGLLRRVGPKKGGHWEVVAEK